MRMKSGYRVEFKFFYVQCFLTYLPKEGENIHLVFSPVYQKKKKKNTSISHLFTKGRRKYLPCFLGFFHVSRREQLLCFKTAGKSERIQEKHPSTPEDCALAM